MKHKTGIIFDMDGTLWDSVDQIVVSWNHILRLYPEAGIQVSREALLSLMGRTMDKFAEALFPHLPMQRAEEILHHCEQAENALLCREGAVLYPYVEEAFRTMKDDGAFIGIVSNCQSGYIEAFLEHYGFQGYVDDFECFGNTGKGKQENLKLLAGRNQLRDTVYIGDTQGDFDACSAIGMPFIFASYGFGSVTENVPCIGALNELPEVLQTIF